MSKSSVEASKLLMIRALAEASSPVEFSWWQPRTWSFTIHLALTMIVLASVALTSLTVLTIGRVQRALSDQIGFQLEAQARSLNNLTAFFLLDKISDLRVLATSDDIVRAVRGRNTTYTGTDEEILSRIRELDREWVDAQGTTPLIAGVTTPDPVRNPAAFQLDRFLTSFGEHSELLLTDRYGATIAATGHLTDYEQSDEEWWQAAWAGGRGHVYISEPQFDESAGITALLLAVPVFNGEAEALGVIRSTLNVADVLSVISTLRIGRTGYASLMDLDGDVFRDPSQDEKVASDIGLGKQLSRGLESSSGFQTDASVIVAHARLVRENFDFGALSTVDSDVVDAIVELGLVTIVRQERDEALAMVGAIETSGRLALAIAVLVSILIALIAARVVTMPLKRLSDAAEAMGRGRLDTPLPTAYSGEIGNLTENFANMASRLQELIASLEFRSEELATSNQSLMREVSERVRAEEELKRYRDQLEERIIERTEALETAQRELMRTEKLSTLGQLTEKIAQEIRSPLGTVAATLFLLRNSLQDSLDERLENALARADRSIKRCDRIVSELFTYSDRQTPDLQNTELDAWLAPLAERYEVPPSVTLVRSFSASCTVVVDRARLHQAIECILLNAVQAIEERDAAEGTLTIATLLRGQRAEIRISDTGPGIPDDGRAHILEPLFSTKPTGIGLGLPLAKVIMDEHQGGSAFEGNGEHGTTVILWLPATPT